MISLQELYRQLQPYYRGFPVFFLFIFIALILANKYIKYSLPVYESVAKLRIADVKEGPSSSNLYKDFDVFTQTNKVQAEVEVIKSRVIVERALTKLDIGTTYYRKGKIKTIEIYNDVPFKVYVIVGSKKIYDEKFSLKIANNSEITVFETDKDEEGEIVKTSFGKSVLFKGAKLIINRNDELIQERPKLSVNGDYEVLIHSKQYCVEHLINDNLDVVPVDKDVPIVRISYKSQVPQKSADLVNSIAMAYIEDYVENRKKEAGVTLDFIEEQLLSANSDLSVTENNIESYRDQNRIINTKQETETNLRKIADQKVQLANIDASLAAINELEQYMQNGKNNPLELAPNFEAFTDLLSTELIKSLKSLQGEREALLLKYTPENPKVKVIDSKIQDIVDYFQESIKNTRENILTKRNEIQKSIIAAEREFDGLAGKEKNMTILNRNFQYKEELYNFLNEKKAEAELAQSAAVVFHRIISKAEVPTKPVNLKSTFIYAIFVFIAIILAIITIFIKELLFEKIEVESNTNFKNRFSYLGQLDFIKKQNKFDTRSIDNLFSNIFLQNDFKSIHSIAIASFFDNEGKTLLADQFSTMLSHADKKVVVFSSVFVPDSEAKKFDNKLMYYEKNVNENYSIISFNSTTTSNLITYTSEAFDEFVKSFTRENTLVVFDTNAVDKSIDAPVLLHKSDLILFVFKRQIYQSNIDELTAYAQKNLLKEIAIVVNYFSFFDMIKFTVKRWEKR